MSDELEPGYPLSWPVGRPRTRHPVRSGFGEGGRGRVPVGRALRELREELRRLGVKQVAEVNAAWTEGREALGL